MPAEETSPTLAAHPTLRLGFLALSDAAPLVAAQELGLFAQHGLRAELHREVGWATVRDKILYRELDAAQIPAPMLWATQLGLGGPPCDVLTALVLNLHGNALTLSTRLRDAGVRDAATFRAEARSRRGENRVTLGVVYPFSSHHLLLRQWLRAAELDPERDVRIVVVPPAQMFRNLTAGTLDGYCAGEPWGSVAVQTGAGWCPAWSTSLAPGHVEKVLMVRADFARHRAREHRALVAALAEACAWCDETANRAKLAHWLSAGHYLNLSVEAILPALTGHFSCGFGQMENVPDFHIFARGGANVPTAAAATNLQAELVAAGLLPRELVTPELPKRLFREDIYRAARQPVSHHHAPTDTTHAAGGFRPTEPCLT